MTQRVDVVKYACMERTEDQSQFKNEIKLWLKKQKLGYSWIAEQCGVSEITVRINQLINSENRKKLKATDITEWLLSLGVLKVEEVNE